MTDLPNSIQSTQLRALVVDDTDELRELVRELMASEGFTVETAADGQEAVEKTQKFVPDVILLDLVMPNMDGIEACRQIRSFSDAYIIMLTSKDTEIDKVIGLSVGADDYVTKPFSPRELVARIRAMFRRPRSAKGTVSVRRFGELVIDTQAREVVINDQSINLTRIEFDILDALSEQPRVALSRSQLLERVWGPNWFGDEHVVDVHVSNLRQKIEIVEDGPRYIVTVRGVGYRMGGDIKPAAQKTVDLSAE